MAIYSSLAGKQVEQQPQTGYVYSRSIYIVLFAVLLLAWLQVVLLPRVNSDTAYQIGQVQSFLKGKGFTVAYASAGDISQIQYVRNGDFAPGYLFIAAPLMSMFSIRTSIAIIDLLSVTVFIVSFFAISRLLAPYASKLFLPLCMLTLAVTPFLYRYCGGTDLLSLAFYFVSLYMLIYLIMNVHSMRKMNYYLLAIGLAITLYLTCFFRYAYYPFLIIPPSILLVSSFLYSKKLVKAFILSFSILICLLLLQLNFQGGGDYIRSRHSHDSSSVQLHWENLQQFNNFIFSTFFNENLIHIIVDRLHIPAAFFFLLQFIVTILIMSIITSGCIRIIKLTQFYDEKAKKAVLNPENIIFFIGGLTIAVNVLFITALSLRYELMREIDWTYVEETRYFAPTMAFLQLFIIFIFFYRRNIFPVYAKIFIVAVLISSFIISVIQQSLSLRSVILKSSSSSLALIEVPDILKKYDSLPIVMLTPGISANYAEFASMGGAALNDANKFFASTIKSTEPVHLFIAIPEMGIEPALNYQLKGFVKSQKATKIADVKTYGNTEIYYTKFQNE